MPGGQDGQIGFKSETTVGTEVTVDQFTPFLSESIQNDIEYLDTQTVSARKVLRLTKQGRKSINGSVDLELANTDLATILNNAFGAVSTTGSDPYTHTFTPDDLTGQAMTIQVGRPDSGGTVRPFTYAGCKISSWTINADVGDIATLSLDILGMSEVTGTALATASYDSTWEPFVFTEASLTIDATSVTTVKSLSLTGDNSVELRHRLGSATSLEPLETSLRSYTGTIVTDFDDLTHYNLFVNGTEAALVCLFDNGTETLTLTMNVQFTGETPTNGGFELLEQPLPFRCISSTDDATAITAELVNSEASAT